jgi:protein tyrosine phosphatase (PTP) superfamily phosphohydrolase (DUF442 family)
LTCWFEQVPVDGENMQDSLRQSGASIPTSASLQDLDICNFLPISDSISTSGQPSAEQLGAIRAAGYEVVINLAMPDSANALPNERELVLDQGMEYLHIPVVFDAPRAEDLAKFFQAMDRYSGKRVWVHCALNWRVSAFMFLYLVIRQGVPVDAAREQLHRIWEPDPVWLRFINEALGLLLGNHRY